MNRELYQRNISISTPVACKCNPSDEDLSQLLRTSRLKTRHSTNVWDSTSANNYFVTFALRWELTTILVNGQPWTITSWYSLQLFVKWTKGRIRNRNKNTMDGIKYDKNKQNDMTTTPSQQMASRQLSWTAFSFTQPQNPWLMYQHCISISPFSRK